MRRVARQRRRHRDRAARRHVVGHLVRVRVRLRLRLRLRLRARARVRVRVRV